MKLLLVPSLLKSIGIDINEIFAQGVAAFATSNTA